MYRLVHFYFIASQDERIINNNLNRINNEYFLTILKQKLSEDISLKRFKAVKECSSFKLKFILSDLNEQTDYRKL